MQARLLLAVLVLLITRPSHAETGLASYYCCQFHGRLTANGETFDQNSMTAAHRRLPFNSIVRVTHTRTGQSVVVRINNRGPFVAGRIIDLSIGAFRQIAAVGRGLVPVTVEVVNTSKGIQ